MEFDIEDDAASDGDISSLIETLTVRNPSPDLPELLPSGLFDPPAHFNPEVIKKRTIKKKKIKSDWQRFLPTESFYKKQKKKK